MGTSVAGAAAALRGSRLERCDRHKGRVPVEFQVHMSFPSMDLASTVSGVQLRAVMAKSKDMKEEHQRIAHARF